MNNETVAVSQSVSKDSLEVARNKSLVHEISRVLGGIADSADVLEAVGEATFCATEISTDSSSHGLRLAALRLRGTSLQLSRLLSEVDAAAGRLEGLAWAKEHFGLDRASRAEIMVEDADEVQS
jgi:hypothetical protein